MLARPQKNQQPEKLFPTLMTGLIIGAVRVVIAISYGVLIFSGELSSYLSFGIGLALISTVFYFLAVSLFGARSTIISSIQDSPTVLFVLLINDLTLGSQDSPEALFGITLFLMAVTTIGTGIIFYTIGRFRLGNLVRFIPYPVMGGFIAGVGWLLVKGAMEIVVGMPLTYTNLGILMEPTILLLWLPALFFSVLLVAVPRRFPRFYVYATSLLVVILLYQVLIWLNQTTLHLFDPQAWLLRVDSARTGWTPAIFFQNVTVDWGVLGTQAEKILVIVVVSLIHVLLNISSIELVTHQDIPVNRELKFIGIANIVSGLFGGMSGYHSLGTTTLNAQIGRESRAVGILAAVITFLIFFLGNAVLVLIPKPVVGVMLMSLGLSMLYEWIVKTITRFSKTDYAVILLIMIIIATVGFIEGVAVGIVATIVLFLVEYSRTRVVKHALTGNELHSNVQRFPYHEEFLAERRNQIYVIKLQGFLFFGTTSYILDAVRKRLRIIEAEPVRFVLFDFRQVTGLDSSVLLTLQKCARLANDFDFELVLTDLASNLRGQLRQHGVLQDPNRVLIFESLDRGLEYCEEEILSSEQITQIGVPKNLSQQLELCGFAPEYTERLHAYLEPFEVEAAETLIRQGDHSQDLFFIEEGKVSIYINLENGELYRLRTMGGGTVVGELSLYAAAPRTASVITNSPTRLYRLTEEAFQKLEREDRELAIQFHRYIAGRISARLSDANRAMEALLR